MEALDERVVEQEHDGCEPPSPAFVPEEDLSDVADILDFGVAHAELPGDEGSVQHQGGNNDGEDDTGDKAED